MTREGLYRWFKKNGWLKAQESPLGGFEMWFPGDRKSIKIYLFESTVLAQGSEVNVPVEVRTEDVIEEDDKLILGIDTILGRLSVSPTYGEYILSRTIKVTYESREAEELEAAEENAEDDLYNLLNHYSRLEKERVSEDWKVVSFIPRGKKEKD